MHGVIFHYQKCLLQLVFKRKLNVWWISRKNIIECACFSKINSISYNSKKQARNFENHLEVLKDIKKYLYARRKYVSFVFFKIFQIAERTLKITGVFSSQQNSAFYLQKIRIILWCFSELELVKNLIFSKRRAGFSIMINISAKKCVFTLLSSFTAN